MSDLITPDKQLRGIHLALDEIIAQVCKARALVPSVGVPLEVQLDRAQLDRIARALPPTFYAGEPLVARVATLTRLWRAEVAANAEQEAEIERLQDALRDALGDES